MDNTTFAYRVSMNLSVAIEGRGQSYKSSLTVDPMEKLETCLKSKTHFWKTFMMRGQQKCIVVLTNKGEEPIIIAPDFFKQSFKEIGACQGCEIVLHEIKNIRDIQSDNEEEGEEEHEEMEAEQEEENNEEAPKKEEEI